MTPEARATFRQTIIVMTDSWLWELANQAMNRVPDPIDYIEMRRKTFGSDLTMSLARLSHGGGPCHPRSADPADPGPGELGRRLRPA